MNIREVTKPSVCITERGHKSFQIHKVHVNRISKFPWPPDYLWEDKKHVHCFTTGLELLWLLNLRLCLHNSWKRPNFFCLDCSRSSLLMAWTLIFVHIWYQSEQISVLSLAEQQTMSLTWPSIFLIKEIMVEAFIPWVVSCGDSGMVAACQPAKRAWTEASSHIY